jgi:glutathione S-transferase
VSSEAQEDLRRCAWVRDSEKKRGHYAKETLEPTLMRLERWFARGGREQRYRCGESFSHVDVLGCCDLDEVAAFVPESIALVPRLRRFLAAVESLGDVRKYISSENRPFALDIGRSGPEVDRRTPIAGRKRAQESVTFSV